MHIPSSSLQPLLAPLTASISEVKRSPAQVHEQAQGKPVAVLNHNRVAFYMVDPLWMHALHATLSPGDWIRVQAMFDQLKHIDTMYNAKDEK